MTLSLRQRAKLLASALEIYEALSEVYREATQETMHALLAAVQRCGQCTEDARCGDCTQALARLRTHLNSIAVARATLTEFFKGPVAKKLGLRIVGPDEGPPEAA